MIRLTYAELKELVRNSIECSFLPGESVYERGDYRRVRRELRALRARGWRKPTAAETKLLAASDKAQVQVRLERALVEFER